MKFKTLIYIPTGEFGVFERTKKQIEGYTTAIPGLLSEEVTMEIIMEYFGDRELTFDIKNYKLVTITLKVEDERIK